jgi:hypothetical protein
MDVYSMQTTLPSSRLLGRSLDDSGNIWPKRAGLLPVIGPCNEDTQDYIRLRDYIQPTASRERHGMRPWDPAAGVAPSAKSVRLFRRGCVNRSEA